MTRAMLLGKKVGMTQLFTVEGKAKYPLWDLVEAGAFDGLTRGGSPIVKTHDGEKEILLKKLKAPVFKKP